MSQDITLSRSAEIDVTVYRVSIGTEEVEFDLKKDSVDDLIIDIDASEAIDALKDQYSDDELKEKLGLT